MSRQTHATGKTIEKQYGAGFESVKVLSGQVAEETVTVRPLPGEDARGTFERLAGLIRRPDAYILHVDVFGALGRHDRAIRTLQEAVGEKEIPLAWIEGADCAGADIAGVQARLVSGATVDPIRVGDRVVGGVYRVGAARFCSLGAIGPTDSGATRGEQTRTAFENLEAALVQAGMDMTHLLRTWLFLDDILSWYDELNAVRNRLFTDWKVFEGLIPASTGIGGKNSEGAALVLDALAMQSDDESVVARASPSPLQCPATDYGSSFSRAVEILTPEHRRILISGTASIEPEGKTIHVGDVEGQIDTTMKVVDGILGARGMGLADISRAILYFRNAADAPAFEKYRADAGLPHFPAITAHNTVCRDDLLFEIEADAVAER